MNARLSVVLVLLALVATFLPLRVAEASGSASHIDLKLATSAEVEWVEAKLRPIEADLDSVVAVEVDGGRAAELVGPISHPERQRDYGLLDAYTSSAIVAEHTSAADSVGAPTMPIVHPERQRDYGLLEFHAVNPKVQVESYIDAQRALRLSEIEAQYRPASAVAKPSFGELQRNHRLGEIDSGRKQGPQALGSRAIHTE